MKGAKPAVLALEKDLSSFGFFQRASASDFITFFMMTLCERTDRGTRAKVEQHPYSCYVHFRHDDIACVVVTDQEYPQRVAFTLIHKVIDDFKAKHPQASWTDDENDTPFPELGEILSRYQNPEEADSITKVQKELDETKVILHKALDSVLKRDEKLDDLVSRSEQLSASISTVNVES
eukprot:gene10239-2395_t